MPLIQNHWQKKDLHKHCNRTANKGSQGGQGNSDRRGKEVRAEKHFPVIWFPRFWESRITLEKHKCCIRITQLDTWLLHIMSKADYSARKQSKISHVLHFLELCLWIPPLPFWVEQRKIKNKQVHRPLLKFFQHFLETSAKSLIIKSQPNSLSGGTSSNLKHLSSTVSAGQ